MNELASKGSDNDTPEEKIASTGWNSAVSAFNGFNALKSGNAVDRMGGVVQIGQAIAQIASFIAA